MFSVNVAREAEALTVKVTILPDSLVV
jgi:hypothetical protein